MGMTLGIMAVGTILSLMFAVFAMTGKKYAGLVADLEASQYPLKDLYVVGFVWNDTKILRLKGNIIKKLRNESMLIYGDQYRDYYAHLTWAQTITLSHLTAAIVFLLAGIAGENGIAIAGFGLVLSIAVGMNFYGAMKKKLQKRSEDCMIELPNMISKLALLTGSGMILREAWFFIADSKDGTIYSLMKQTCSDMENGASDIDAIHKFGILSNVPEIKKFSSALIQSLEKGSSDLVGFLAMQSSEMWAHKKQIMLQKGEVAASKLVAPVALMFGGILIIILTAALAGMSL